MGSLFLKRRPPSRAHVNTSCFLVFHVGRVSVRTQFTNQPRLKAHRSVIILSRMKWVNHAGMLRGDVRGDMEYDCYFCESRYRRILCVLLSNSNKYHVPLA
jgi:hypothetical protein